MPDDVFRTNEWERRQCVIGAKKHKETYLVAEADAEDGLAVRQREGPLEGVDQGLAPKGQPIQACHVRLPRTVNRNRKMRL
jgi:hypothetical protein